MKASWIDPRQGQMEGRGKEREVERRTASNMLQIKEMPIAIDAKTTSIVKLINLLVSIGRESCGDNKPRGQGYSAFSKIEFWEFNFYSR